MSSTLPRQSAAYRGPITNTERWSAFSRRPGDIFVCTPPKCGTTWTQAICAMLVFGRADHGQMPGVISPWLDAEFATIEDDVAKLDAQTHRRFIKTHSPFDGIPYYPDCTYFGVLRDPRDAYFSMINHRDNMTDQELANTALPSGPDAFAGWLNGTLEPGTWDRPALSALTHFLSTYWRYRHVDNVHLYHYSDMKKDLRGTIAGMAAALSIDLSEAQLVEFTQAASFEAMKRNASQFAPESGRGFWKRETDFFARGANQQWKDALSPAELAAFDARLAELLPDADARNWLLNGGSTL